MLKTNTANGLVATSNRPTSKTHLATDKSTLCSKAKYEQLRQLHALYNAASVSQNGSDLSLPKGHGNQSSVLLL